MVQQIYSKKIAVPYGFCLKASLFDVMILFVLRLIGTMTIKNGSGITNSSSILTRPPLIWMEIVSHSMT